MANKKVVVRIKYNGIIPLLCCYGPVRRVVLSQADVETISNLIGSQYIEILEPKKAPVATKPVVKEEKKEVVKEIIVEEVVQEKEENIQEPVQEEVVEKTTEQPVQEEVVEEVPRRRGRKATVVKEEE